MNHDTPGGRPADDLPFLPPAVSPRRREPEVATGGGDELAAPYVAHHDAFRADSDAGSAAEDLDALEELEVLPGADVPRDDFPWLLPAEPASAEGASTVIGGGYGWEAPAPSAADEDDGFPWDEPASSGAAGPTDTVETPLGWEGEPSIGYAEPAAGAEAGLPEPVAEGWDDRWGGSEEDEQFAAAEFAWDEESEEVEPVSAAPEAEAVAGWGWSVPGAEEPEELPGAGRWQSAAEELREDGEGAGEAWIAPGLEAEWAEVEAAVGAGSGDSAALEEVAARLERIAGALRAGNASDALEHGDPLQLLITGYALGYAEARKGKGG